jgi:hypothetical protein
MARAFSSYTSEAKRAFFRGGAFFEGLAVVEGTAAAEEAEDEVDEESEVNPSVVVVLVELTRGGALALNPFVTTTTPSTTVYPGSRRTN